MPGLIGKSCGRRRKRNIRLIRSAGGYFRLEPASGENDLPFDPRPGFTIPVADDGHGIAGDQTCCRPEFHSKVTRAEGQRSAPAGQEIGVVPIEPEGAAHDSGYEYQVTFGRTAHPSHLIVRDSIRQPPGP